MAPVPTKTLSDAPSSLKEFRHEQRDQSDSKNDYAVKAVPVEKRSSVWILGLQLAGVTICISGLFAGAALAQGLNLRDVITSVLIGNTILAVYGGLVGAIGARLGISTTMLSRRSFGRLGSSAVSFMATITLVGWYAVQVGFFGQTIHAMCPDLGFLTSIKGAALWGGLLMMVTAYFGYRGLSVLSVVAVPVLFGLSSWGIAKAINVPATLAHVPLESFGLAQGITMTVGGFAVGAVLLSDLTRYARSEKDSWIATIFGFIVVNSYIILAGAITSIATNSGDLPKAMLALGMGIPALLVLVLSQWTTNDNNLYSASLAVSNVMRVRKALVVIVLGLIATTAGVCGLADSFVTWLTYLGILIPPVAGIIIADFWILGRKDVDEQSQGAWRHLNPIAFLAWGAGASAGMFIQWGIPAVNSLVCALGAYVIGEVLMQYFRQAAHNRKSETS